MAWGTRAGSYSAEAQGSIPAQGVGAGHYLGAWGSSSLCARLNLIHGPASRHSYGLWGQEFEQPWVNIIGNQQGACSMD